MIYFMRLTDWMLEQQNGRRKWNVTPGDLPRGGVFSTKFYFRTPQLEKDMSLPTSRRTLGRFYWEESRGDVLEPKQRARLAEIAPYYTDKVVVAMLLPIISKSDRLSLRALDWLVTNYSKKKPIVYKASPPGHPMVPVNMHNEYKSWLSNHKRRNFDMFRRRKRIFFNLGKQEYRTTVGQLNFFYWAARYGVLDYARKHIDEIETDHAVSTKRPKEEGEGEDDKEKVDGCDDEEEEEDVNGRATEVTVTNTNTSTKKRPCDDKKSGRKRRRRRELSRAPDRTCYVFPMVIDVVFDPVPIVASVFTSAD